jgi:hypothetical protein
MVRHAQRRIAVVDNSKFGVAADWRICDSSDLHILITDSGATDEIIAPFEKAQIRVMRVSESPVSAPAPCRLAKSDNKWQRTLSPENPGLSDKALFFVAL